MNKARLLTLLLSLVGCSAVSAQTLCLDSCRAMALRNNKQLSISRSQEQVARLVRQSAKTKYLPHIDVAGGYLLTSRELSLLSDGQKYKLSHLGSSAVGVIDSHSGGIDNLIGKMLEEGIISADEVQKIQQVAAAGKAHLEGFGNALGEKINDAFRTDTRNVFVGSVMLRQPIYMGGAITAGNRMAEIAEHMATLKTDVAEDEVLYSIDQAYWMVVSLKQKQRLADSFLALVSHLDEDVQKMIKEGVATRADGLKVSVRVNEAEMAKTQVESGLSLSRMLLCQLCGLPMDSDITLADENEKDLSTMAADLSYDRDAVIDSRAEIRLLNDAVGLTEQATKLARAAYLPQVALAGGYLISNPNVFNSFEKRFGGVFNVGIMVRMPVLDWGDARYKVRAAKVTTNIANMALDDAKEKIELQLTQCDYKLKVANKKLVAALKSIQQAEENLRCANIGFKEGVMSTTEVMAAQTAWYQAQTQKIDAQIDVKLSEAGMKKALGRR